jgi:ankyrin repeat protein
VTAAIERVVKCQWVEVNADLDAGFPTQGRHPTTGTCALHWAARRGHMPTLTRLLALGADVNARDLFGATPLHAAMSSKALAPVEALVREGVPVAPTRSPLARFRPPPPHGHSLALSFPPPAEGCAMVLAARF